MLDWIYKGEGIGIGAFTRIFSGEGSGRDNLFAPKGHKLSGKRTGFGRSSGKVRCSRLLGSALLPPTRQPLVRVRGNLSGTKTGKAYGC